MTHNIMTPALPDYVVSPGDFIQEWLEENDVNAAELARRLDVTPKHVSELLSGKAPLSAALSIALERVTGTPAKLWNRTGAIYREDLARLAEYENLEAECVVRAVTLQSYGVSEAEIADMFDVRITTVRRWLK